MQGCIDIHTHRHYDDDTLYIYNAFLNPEKNIFSNCSVGIHPWYIDNVTNQLNALEQLLQENSNVRFLGECGLDKHSTTPWELQVTVFKAQIDLALQYHKPLIIHSVRAYQECLVMLRKVTVPVVFHGFNKNKVLATQIVAAGHYVSIGVNVLERIDTLQSILSVVPLNKLFLETDDKKNTHIVEVYKVAASILSVDVDSLILQLQKNYFHILDT
jgi:TatD DNase family protein